MRRVIGSVAVLVFMWVPLQVKATGLESADNPSIAKEFALAERAFGEGCNSQGVKALERAAQQGSLQAQMDVARIYDKGDKVAQDELKACKIYSNIADSYSQIDRNYPSAKLVAEAFRSWGMCYVKGLPAPSWNKDLSRAAVLFYQGGVILEDAPSLFQLAKLFLSGEGIRQNPSLAVHYLYNAARKRYPPAQALLGSLMWEGKVTKRRGPAGLALLILAREATSPEDRAWIASLHDDAMITASATEEAEARRLVQEWKSIYRPEETQKKPEEKPTAPPLTTQHISQADTIPLPVARDLEKAEEYSSTTTGEVVPEACAALE